ncbi:MAG: iron(III) transport system substrate-binding protein [Planctomycetota bacterium]|jgi:iron(III) transport system substrate-binding protein
MNLPTRNLRTLAFALAGFLAACAPEPDLVVYVSLDHVFSAPLIQEFEAETGLVVRADYDTEASKTVGLVKRIQEEGKVKVRCDVYWNNEVAQTVRLAEQGLLQPYDSPSAADIPEQFRDEQMRWTGFAARARVLIVNTDLVPDPSVITGMADLLDERWAGKCGIARPLTGTTLTHATALYEVLGEERATDWLQAIADGQHTNPPRVQVASSNGQVMRLVGAGTWAWGWTDTDDFNVALLKGYPVAAVFPDQTAPESGGKPLGTLLIPNTISIMKDAPHLDAAKRFVDWALSRELEERLAHSRSAQIPVRADVPRPDHVRSDFEIMEVDYAVLGARIGERTRTLKDMFLSN